jgi:hypothetical protein
MLSVPAVHLDDGGFVTIGIGIRGRAAECLSPVSGEPLDMLGVEAVAECMIDHVVGHHPAVPGVGKTAQAVDAPRYLEDSLHASHGDNPPVSMQVAVTFPPSTGVDLRWHGVGSETREGERFPGDWWFTGSSPLGIVYAWNRALAAPT